MHLKTLPKDSMLYWKKEKKKTQNQFWGFFRYGLKKKNRLRYFIDGSLYTIRLPFREFSRNDVTEIGRILLYA